MPSNNWKNHPNGQSYIFRISAGGRSDVLGWARTVLGERIQGVFNDYSEKHGWGDPGRIQFSNKSDRGRAGRESGQTDDGRSQAPERADAQSRQEGLSPLPGYPATKAHEGPDAKIVSVAEAYAKANKIPYKRQSEYAVVDKTIVQASDPKRTGLLGLGRISGCLKFAGNMETGRNYVLVDETVTHGGTFFALANHIADGGGKVAAVVAESRKQQSTVIKADADTVTNVMS